MSVRPYKLFGERELAAARTRLEQRLASWTRAWLPARASLDLECAPACAVQDRFPASDGRWTKVAGGDDQWIAHCACAAELRALAGAIYFAEHAVPAGAAGVDSEAAQEAAATALDELAGCLVDAPNGARETSRGPHAAPHRAHFAPGSACLAVRASMGGARLDFLSSPSWALALLAHTTARAALADRAQGVASQHVQLKVLAGSAEMDLRTFRTLKPGDVLALDTRLDEPMAVVLAAGAEPRLCVGRLGKAGRRKAVALASTA